jgi:creatinine amidohydrolase
MFPDELEEAFAECPLVYFTYGLCEPHGPQCAVGLDELKAHAIAVEAAGEIGGIVAPPDYWHCHELGGYAIWSEKKIGNVPRTWLTAEPPWMHFKRVCYQIRAAEAIGFHAAILFTGHYGPNFKDLQTIVGLIQPYVRMRLYGLPEFEANEPGFGPDGPTADHAGKVETSLLWHLEPDCVDISRLPHAGAEGRPDDPFQRPPYFAMGQDAADSDRRVGARMVQDEIAWLARKADELLAAHDPDRVVKGLLTFDDVERFWESEVRPRLVEFATMQTTWGQDAALKPGSRWYANWAVPDRG